MLARFFYSVILCVLQPLVVVRLLYKSLRLSSYRGNLLQRYGFFGPNLQNAIWVHAVSVGETITAKPIIEALLAQHYSVVVTTTTPTGAEQVRKLFGGDVCHRYIPQDIPWVVARFIRGLQPAALIIVETELWPNLIHQCAKHDVPTVLINGRLSEKSANGYQRIAALSRPMLQSLTHCCVQTELEASRFEALGVSRDRLSVIPSLKFDAKRPEDSADQAKQWRQRFQWHDRFIWVAASTHSGEEQAALAAHQHILERIPDAVLVLVPRHPDRFHEVSNLCSKSGLRYDRYTAGGASSETQVWCADVMGQMWSLLALSDVVFVGNSLNGGGGHNVMEPALCEKPMITGEAMFNFQAVTEHLVAAGALRMLKAETELADQVLALAEPERRQAMGQAALQVAESHRGGVALTLSVLATLIHA